jgi:5-oxoprolinase (ATP-hydrolysing)
VQAHGWQFWIDRGGTFTDVVARDPEGNLKTVKLLSENPTRYRDPAVAGICAALGLPAGAPIPDASVASVKMGTTVATNALLERKGARTLLLIDAGFADLLRIGTQARPRLFTLEIRKPEPLFSAVEEVGGRIDAAGRSLTPIDEPAVRSMLSCRKAEGFEAVAIALAHAWQFPQSERRLEALAREAGFAQVSVSHQVSPLLGWVARANTTVVDAYLSPVLHRYVDQVAGELGSVPLYFMQSNGGLTHAAGFQGKDAILSGPAAGVVGAARTAEAAGFQRVIGFDMGGTSTDVSLYAGKWERAFDTEVAGVQLRVPIMAIHTIAAGGGSILHFDGGRFRVGPDSAGASPGPACYRRGGPLTVTDANVMVGKIQAAHFPAIFGPDGTLPLDTAVVVEGFTALAREIAATTGIEQDALAVAEGFLRIAVANMAQAIKHVSLEKGHDVADFVLQCFGGAAGQHACLVAGELGMDTVMIHPYAGVLSAYGMGLADQSALRHQAIERELLDDALGAISQSAAALAAAAVEALEGEGPARLTRTAYLRYDGTDTALPVDLGSVDAMRTAFDVAHRAHFGFSTPERTLIVESLSVEAVRSGENPRQGTQAAARASPLMPLGIVRLWTGGRQHEAPVFEREALLPGDAIAGPALIREAIATTIVEPGWGVSVDACANLLLRRIGTQAAAGGGTEAHPVKLELFSNLFMAVAERMGVVLRNTATSVNIKERLDFSCALFDSEGNLVANAPHVPVHLGAMGESVRVVLHSRRGTLRPGDSIALNDPFHGGTHLPDVTVVTPVFDETGRQIRFFVANRSHHADIGGRTPGSMPPDSATLAEEGVLIDNFPVAAGGKFREREFRALLTGAPWPARSPDTNVADIKAQVAANEMGIRELQSLLARYGWPQVTAYMGHVMANAEESIRRVIDRLGSGSFDYRMDDGALLKVCVRVNRAKRSAVIDFTGTGGQSPGNFNAPKAVTRAVVLYAFRCLVDADLPLNEGCLAPLEIVLPAGSFLDPAPGSAVVAGNTEISQAIACALLGALGASASAQATMNNFLFGNPRYQYYETICGGAGAGPGFTGASAVHTHMTNTRITDPEILELRYPIRLERFAIRAGSGGAGRYRGGDGVVRAIRALEPMTATLVASRRTVAPFGLAGGHDGATGRQWIERADGALDAMSGHDRVELAAGDLVVIETPGGGGYGTNPGDAPGSNQVAHPPIDS